MAMSPEAQAAYNAALTKVLFKHGVLVDSTPDIYGWMDLDYEHAWECKLSTKNVPVEDRWDEFMGTFSDEDTTRHGIVIHGVSCACGKLQQRSIRWHARMQEIAEAVFEEAFGSSDK